MPEVLTWAIKPSKLFNDDIEGGVRQVDLSQQYGYDKRTISQIVDIFSRLKDSKSDMSDFSNHDMNLLARVECDAFRYALENMPDPSA